MGLLGFKEKRVQPKPRDPFLGEVLRQGLYPYGQAFEEQGL